MKEKLKKKQNQKNKEKQKKEKYKKRRLVFSFRKKVPKKTKKTVDLHSRPRHDRRATLTAVHGSKKQCTTESSREVQCFGSFHLQSFLVLVMLSCGPLLFYAPLWSSVVLCGLCYGPLRSFVNSQLVTGEECRPTDTTSSPVGPTRRFGELRVCRNIALD